MKYLIRKSVVDVIGRIWQPGIGPCAHRYELRPSALPAVRLYGPRSPLQNRATLPQEPRSRAEP